MKYLIGLLLSLFTTTLYARDTLFFCQSIALNHGFARNIHIENGDDFQLNSMGKYSIQITTKDKEPRETTISFDTGSSITEFALEQDCSRDDLASSMDVDFY